MYALQCPHCTAPVPATVEPITICPFCGHVLADVPVFPWGTAHLRDDWEGRPEDMGKPRLAVGRHRYVVLGQIARGDSCDVFLGRRDARLTERVVLKVLRAEEDADLLANEARVLSRLAHSGAAGASFFGRLVPNLVAHGEASLDGAKGPLATVLRFKSGFTATLDDIRAAYPDGVRPETAVWIWKRALELLGFVHRSGLVHGAVLPRHLLVHPRDHGVTLVGWAAAAWRHGREAGPPLATRADAESFYPTDVWDGATPSPDTDLTMCARAILSVLGGDVRAGRSPAGTPSSLAALLRIYADPSSVPRTDDAWALKEDVTRAAREAFGPSKFVVLEMPPKRR